MPKSPLIVTVLALCLLGVLGSLWWLNQADEEEIKPGKPGAAPSNIEGEETKSERREATRESSKVIEGRRETLRDEEKIAAAAIAWIAGQALDEANRQPVVGALVKMTAPGAAVETRTDEQGRFRVAATAANLAWRLRLRSEGMTSAIIDVDELIRDEERDLGVVLMLAAGRVRGVVTAAGGVPVKDGEVALFRETTTSPTGGLDLQKIFKAIFQDDDPIEWVATRDDGSFVFEDVPAGRYVIRASGPALESRFARPFNVDSQAAAPRVNIQLPSGGILRGKIVDENERPIAGATVAALPNTDNNIPEVFMTQKAWSTGDGSFEFTTLGREKHFIMVRAEGYTGGTVKDVVPGQSKDLVIKLTVGGRLHGRAFDKATGTSLKGIQVMVMTNKNSFLVETVTDEDGNYELNGINRDDSMMVMVRDAKYSLDLGKGMSRAVIMGGLQVDAEQFKKTGGKFDLALIRGATVKGRVFDRLTNQGVSGAWVRVGATGSLIFNMNAGSKRRVYAKTDENGHYELSDVPAGEKMVALAWHPNYHNYADPKAKGRGMMGIMGSLGPDTFELSSGVTSENHDIGLVKGVSLQGKVVDVEGNAVKGARIFGLSSEGQPDLVTMLFDSKRPFDLSDKSGFFKLRGLKGDEGMTVQVTHPDYPTGGKAVIENVATLGGEIKVVIEAGTSLSGVLSDHTGQELVEQTIMVSVETGVPRTLGSPMIMFMGADTKSVTQTAITDRSGHFEFTDLPAGEATLSCPKDSGKTLAGEGTKVTLEAGGSKTVALQLVKTLEISGRVVDADGKPVEGTWVQVKKKEEGQADLPESLKYGLSSGEDGEFVLKGLPPGYRVEISGNSMSASSGEEGQSTTPVMQTGSVSATAGDTGVRLILSEE
ncbi:MAG: carboxypeptidase regulatory-like domain-containing protein [Planctomycetota bacterium]